MKNVLENRLISLQNLQEFKNLLIQKLQNGDIPLPGGAPATTTTPGIVKPDGTSITVDSDGTISAVGGGSDVPIATPEIAGKVKPDGTTITITEDGTISSNGGTGASDWNDISNKPFSTLDPDTLEVENDTLKVIGGGASSWNELEGKPFESIGSGLTVSSNQLKESYATSSTIGGVRITWNSSTNSLYIYTQD